MKMYKGTIGANILDSLTTGMYSDSKVIFREYIQNSCDAIDVAIKEGILSVKDLKDRVLIEIDVDRENRRITITDYGYGIKAESFMRVMGDIAHSDKKIGENKGFRGIGRLAGLAYCDKLIFTSKYKDETVISSMTCDATYMRELLNEHYEKKQYSVEDILSKIFSFSVAETDDKEEHYFKVELTNIKNEDNDLLDVEKIRSYLSFVAPVCYSPNFYLREEIYKYADKHNHRIDEYKITINNEELVKEYALNYTSRGEAKDAIHYLEFHELKSEAGEELGWMWIGVTGFKGAIPQECVMRCIRVRKENIQIGDGSILQELFTETRGPNYFIGEVFATSKDLIPNSQRNDFNSNETKDVFKKVLGAYVKSELNSIYRAGSEIQAAIKKINLKNKEIGDLSYKIKSGKCIDIKEEKESQEKLTSLKDEVEENYRKICKYKPQDESEPQTLKEKVYCIQIKDIIRLETFGNEGDKENTGIDAHSNGSDSTSKDDKGDTSSNKSGQENNKKNRVNRRSTPTDITQKYRANKLSRLSRNEQKLISKVYKIIKENSTEEVAEKIMTAIEDKFR